MPGDVESTINSIADSDDQWMHINGISNVVLRTLEFSEWRNSLETIGTRGKTQDPFIWGKSWSRSVSVPLEVAWLSASVHQNSTSSGWPWHLQVLRSVDHIIVHRSLSRTLLCFWKNQSSFDVFSWVNIIKQSTVGSWLSCFKPSFHFTNLTHCDECAIAGHN